MGRRKEVKKEGKGGGKEMEGEGEGKERQGWKNGKGKEIKLVATLYTAGRNSFKSTR